MFTGVQVLMARVRAELDRLRRDEGGYSTEAVVVTALLAALAIAVIAIIVIKVTQKANGINL
ncbi:hypothetical protein ACQPZF_35955 [Actinosynnema sp. CS-041913]|uniref:hypothetical protein n=1 Tax=Actinosynnema sp. CS-041913 TaxID=3239917 RepID=UPI003D8B5D2C